MAQSPNIPTLLLCSILLFSCVKEEEMTRIEEGLPTEIVLTLSTTAKPVTRADANAIEGETRFLTADVFFFEEATGIQVNHHRLDASEFSTAQTGNGYDSYTYTSTSKIPATTGKRKMIVGVNLSQELSEKLDGEPIATFTTVPYTVDLSNPLGIIELTGKANFNNLSSFPALYDPRFVMFSVAPMAITIVKDPDFGAKENSPVVQVQRMVAKVSVEKAQMMDTISDCWISNFVWSVKQVNTKTFWVQPADKKDPNWATAPMGDLAIAPITTESKTMNEYDTPFSQFKFAYIPENTTKDYLRGQLTYIEVKATIAPKQFKAFINPNDVNVGYQDIINPPYTVSRDFYVVTYNNGTSRAYFIGESVAKAFAADYGVDLNTIEYYKGECIWPIFLNPNNNYNVLRNEYYRCRITKIVGIGRPPNEDLLDPHLPPVASNDIMVDVDVLDWDSLFFNSILE